MESGTSLKDNHAASERNPRNEPTEWSLSYETGSHSVPSIQGATPRGGVLLGCYGENLVQDHLPEISMDFQPNWIPPIVPRVRALSRAQATRVLQQPREERLANLERYTPGAPRLGAQRPRGGGGGGE